MDCKEFLANYSAYRDGEVSWVEREAFDAHIDECESCAHYDRVVQKGTDVFRHLPELTVSDDFAERLQHRLWHVDDEERSYAARRTAAARTTATLSVAAMVAAAAWVPLMQPRGDVPALPAVAAQAPPREGFVQRLTSAPEATAFTSRLAQIGVAVREMPYHDVVFHGDGALVQLASFSEGAAAPLHLAR